MCFEVCSPKTAAVGDEQDEDYFLASAVPAAGRVVMTDDDCVQFVRAVLGPAGRVVMTDDDCVQFVRAVLGRRGDEGP